VSIMGARLCERAAAATAVQTGNAAVASRVDPVCGMASKVPARATPEALGVAYYFLLARLPHEISRRTPPADLSAGLPGRAGS